MAKIESDDPVAQKIPFSRDLDFEYGVSDQVAPAVRRVIARNPGPFTLYGTGTYIVGTGSVAVIDPGPDMSEHFDALMAELEGEKVTHIVITHTHSDHSPLSRRLADATGGLICGHGGILPSQGVDGVGIPRMEEAVDRALVFDVTLSDGDLIEGEGWTLEAVHTPGHIADHICYGFREQNILFSGDHVMGWSTSVVVPPDGSMVDYMASLETLLGRSESVYWPTHGPAITEPIPFVKAYIAHRLDRERQIFGQLKAGPQKISDMVAVLYADVAKELHPAAGQSVYAQLIKMVDEGRVSCDAPPTVESLYALK